MPKAEKKKILIIALLSVAILLLGIFVCIFKLSLNPAYRAFAFGINIYNVVMLLILAVAEIASTKFDRTKCIYTVYATIFLFLSYITSANTFLNIEFFGGSLPHEVVANIMLILHNLFMVCFAYFMFLFFERVYAKKSFYKYHLIVFLLTTITHGVFAGLNLFVGTMVVVIIQAIYSIGFDIYYIFKMKGKDNTLPGYLTSIMVIIVMISFILDIFFAQEYNFFGIDILLHMVVTISYIFVYFHFLLARTSTAYSYEDEIKAINEKKEHRMKVSCFHCFDCYYDDKHLDFPSKKAKEYFALLVILRGKALTMEKAITYLWPDKDVEKSKDSYRNVIMKLRKYFKSINYDAITYRRGEAFLDTSNLECDYYDVIDGKNEYDGSPLMPEYDWSLDFENF